MLTFLRVAMNDAVRAVLVVVAVIALRQTPAVQNQWAPTVQNHTPSMQNQWTPPMQSQWVPPPGPVMQSQEPKPIARIGRAFAELADSLVGAIR